VKVAAAAASAALDTRVWFAAQSITTRDRFVSFAGFSQHCNSSSSTSPSFPGLLSPVKVSSPSGLGVAPQQQQKQLALPVPGDALLISALNRACEVSGGLDVINVSAPLV